MDKLASAVKATLGPKGRNVVLDKKWGAATRTQESTGEYVDDSTITAKVSVASGSDSSAWPHLRQTAGRLHPMTPLSQDMRPPCWSGNSMCVPRPCA